MNNLEVSLRTWCDSPEQNSFLFEKEIYLPMTYMAASIATKFKVKSKNMEETISDMVSHVSITLPDKYDHKKGNAKAMAYIVMSQYLIDSIRKDSRGKRDSKQLFYIEDLDFNDNEMVSIIEVSVDNINELKETLLNNRQLFEHMNNKLQRKIKDCILECVEFPERYESRYNSFTTDIAKKCKTNIDKVYATIKEMNNIQRQYLVTQ